MSSRQAARIRSVSWFTIIGVLAAVVHYVVAVTLESQTTISPGWANLGGFILAFPVSYLGHHYLSFAGNRTSHLHALPRFLLVACSGFLANQFLLLALLYLLPLPFWFILGGVMAIVAAGTYLLSHYWAFAREQSP
ncbi:GtrA family protein [Methylobacillus caricis]|uniref:GtrA family protein n=1 Tax=Methylobacillus caricis TaxID=1971611 RepID=UPI001CFFAC49|nr:GtrA family protein [Methylobacillus caricis]MCB5187545.1 GtrA family protein [Methylobacillus caricis]